jgi:threonine dehydrogenase-like Zn-dependent dehydrogenase
MKAVVFDKELKLAELEKPVPAPGEALVRVTLAGICNTDYEITKGYMGYAGILGHEAVGIVEEINDPEKS